jgi:hypothetical protein
MSTTSAQQEKRLSEKAKNNLYEIELDAATSSQYFKPKPGTVYIVEIDLNKHEIKPTENPKFTDSQGKPLKRYEAVILHPNNGREQIWTVGKTVIGQIIAGIRKGFKVFEVEWTGEDRSTIYKIRGIQWVIQQMQRIILLTNFEHSGRNTITQPKSKRNPNSTDKSISRRNIGSNH